MVEIERKFLVKKYFHNELEKHEPKQIIQAYLVNEKSRSVRIRLMNEKAFLTIKSAMTGITRHEFEYEIPKTDAVSLIKSFGLKTLTKKRYCLEFNSKTWEIDVFEGGLEGLVLAEIELTNEDEEFDIPDWVDEEVTFDPNYLNACLINRL